MATKSGVDGERVAVIRTSDRALFKRCRRKWGLGSGLRENREPVDRPSYFWIGTGGHFALEDYHGYNFYGHPVEAFKAYVRAQRAYCKDSRRNLPDDWEEQAALGEAILENYLIWLEERDPLETVWIDGEPQVEVRCTVELPIAPEILEQSGYDKVVYQGTLDRVVRYEGQLFVLDWKFYKSLNNSPYLDWDQQMSSYVWLGSTVYDEPIAGAILVQLRKDVPNPPKILSSGKLSTAQNQKTSHRLYRQSLIEIYGDVSNAPHQYVEYLNGLAAAEGADRDDFIRRDRTYRNKAQQEAEGTRILMEVEEMINPQIPLYTNPTRDCSWDCQFQEICLMMDRDDHWQDVMEESTVSRDTDPDAWRNYLD